MAPPSNRDFAFIINQEPFPRQYLVEISRRTKTVKKNIDLYKPNVIFTPPTMNVILKSLLDNDELFNFHRQVVKKAMVEAITANNPAILESTAALQAVAVESVVKQEILKVLNATPSTPINCTRGLLTRSKERQFRKIFSNWHELRTKRLRDEHYLSNTFITAIERSKCELKYIMKKLKI